MAWREEVDAWAGWVASSWSASWQAAWDTVVSVYEPAVTADPEEAGTRASTFTRAMFGSGTTPGATHLVHDITELEGQLSEADVKDARTATWEQLVQLQPDSPFDADTLSTRVNGLAGPFMREADQGTTGFVPIVIGAVAVTLSTAALAWAWAKVTEASAAYNETVYYREELAARAEAARTGKPLAKYSGPPPKPQDAGGGSWWWLGVLFVGGVSWWAYKQEKAGL